MRIGSAWSRAQKETQKPFISVVFEETFLKLCPQLQNCNLILSYIDPKDRKSDKSPGWTVNLVENKPKPAEQEATEVANEEIPY